MTLNRSLHKKNKLTHQTKRIDPDLNLLTDIQKNSCARILGFAPSISADRRTHLQAYGIIPGNILVVRQKQPVTIVQVEHTELALESGLADLIYVTSN